MHVSNSLVRALIWPRRRLHWRKRQWGEGRQRSISSTGNQSSIWVWAFQLVGEPSVVWFSLWPTQDPVLINIQGYLQWETSNLRGCLNQCAAFKALHAYLLTCLPGFSVPLEQAVWILPPDLHGNWWNCLLLLCTKMPEHPTTSC